MKLHKFNEVVARAEEMLTVSPETEIFQQWHCAHCGTVQTMEQANTFFHLGVCEQCDHTTDIKADGCNFLLSLQLRHPPKNAN